MTSRTINAATTRGAEAKALLSAAAVRRAAHRMLALAESGVLDDWTLDAGRLAPTADVVAQVIRERYPALEIPFHARWRHFAFAGRDLWREIATRQKWANPAARARAEFDLAITSVLLDAGAGAVWGYSDEATGITASRSEGLALASLRWFAGGGMSMDAREPLRVDAAALRSIDVQALNAAFKVSDRNPLVGLVGRAELLNRLGVTLQTRGDLFALADTPRPGGLFDVLAQRATGGRLPAALILETLLDAFGTIWHGRPALDGVPLGDCWIHPAFDGPSPADRYAPLHKLSQWLAYSLIEPLTEAGIEVHSIDELTGLAEYRNGGLFVDLGVLVPRDPTAVSRTHEVSSAFVVGWRSMTVALLDRIAPLVRERLGIPAQDLPLARLLEGGTWAAGRKVARERRADGSPPFNINSDGTVF